MDTHHVRPWLPTQSGGVISKVSWTEPDGTVHLATGGTDGSVRIWNAEAGSVVGAPLYGHFGAVFALACWSEPDGTRVASSGTDGQVIIWSPLTGERIADFKANHIGGIMSITAWRTPDGTLCLATGSYDCTVQLFDGATGQRLREPLVAHTGAVLRLITWEADDGSRRLASASDDGTVRVWNLDIGVPVGQPFTGHSAAVEDLCVWRGTAGEVHIASASEDGTVQVWEPDTNHSNTWAVKVHDTGVWALSHWQSPDGVTRLAVGCGDGTIRFYRADSGEPVSRSLAGPASAVRTMSVLPRSDGSVRLATVGTAGTIQIWDPNAGVLVREIHTGHVAAVWALTSWQSGTGEWMFASSGPSGAVRLWNPTTGSLLGEIDTGHVSGVWALTNWNTIGGHRIASGGLDGRIRIWDSISLDQIGDPILAHAASVAALCAWRTADGAYRLASAGDDGAVRVWNPETGAAVCPPMLDHTGGVLALTSWQGLDGGHRLASAGTDGVVRIWDPETGDLAGPALAGHAAGLWSLVNWRSTDGLVRLAVGGFDGRIQVWDAENGSRLGDSIAGHTGAIRTLELWIRPDGAARLASGGADTIRVWDIDAGAPVGTPLHGHEAAVRALTWVQNPQGEVQVVSGADDGAVMLWDPDSGMAVRTIEVATVGMWGLSDAPADTDLLDRGSLADAIVAQLCRPAVDAHGRRDGGPAVVTIEGPWGSGKTTLMRMIQQRLPAPAASPEPEQRQLRIGTVLRQLKAPPHRNRPTAKAEPPNSGGPASAAVSAWFNPWAHQSGDQIWAGLTKAIIDAAEPVLYPTPARREQYWLSHNEDRVDRHLLRRTIQRRLISPLLGVAVAATAFPLVIGLVQSNQTFRVLDVHVTTAVLALLLPATFLLAGLVHTAVRHRFGLAADYVPAELLRGPVTGVHLELGRSAATDGPDAPADPLQHASSGSLYLHQHDVNALLADIADLGLRVVVFIDDLDRCRAGTTAEVFEAINIFLFGLTAVSDSRCQFVIGMDPVIVAAHLDNVYNDLQEASVGLHGDDPSPGWAFLRKLVQLPVSVSRLGDGGVDRFVQAVTAGESALPGLVHAALQSQTVPQRPSTPGPASPYQPNVERPSPAGRRDLLREPVRQITVPWRTMEQHPSVRQFIAERLAAQPERSLREAKRQLNVWQLHERMLSQDDPMTDAQASIGRAQCLFQLAEIVTRWPALLPYLRKRVDGTSGIGLLASAARDDEQWLHVVQRLGLDPVPHGRAMDNLRSILIGKDTAGIVELADRLL